MLLFFFFLSFFWIVHVRGRNRSLGERRTKRLEKKEEESKSGQVTVPHGDAELGPRRIGRIRTVWDLTHANEELRLDSLFTWRPVDTSGRRTDLTGRDRTRGPVRSRRGWTDIYCFIYGKNTDTPFCCLFCILMPSQSWSHLSLVSQQLPSITCPTPPFFNSTTEDKMHMLFLLILL